MEPEHQKPLNILLADDDKDDRFFFEKALNEIPVAHQLKTVADGAHLMEYLLKNSAHLPDVLFLDLNMPRKNGHECLEEIKSHKLLKQFPIIIYTTSVRDEVADMLYQNGAHYYLHKCSFPMLSKCIQHVLDLLAKNPKQPSRKEFVIDTQNA